MSADPIGDLLYVATGTSTPRVCRVCSATTRSDFCPHCLAPLSPEALALSAGEDAIVRDELKRMGIEVVR